MATVAEIMTRSVVTLRPESPVRMAAETFVAHAISGAPVVDAESRVVGVVSETDLVRNRRGHPSGHRSLIGLLLADPSESSRLRDEAGAVTVGALMTSPAITIEPTSTVVAAASMMIDRDVDRLPVVHDGQLVGIVTKTDIVRSMLRNDVDLASEIRRRTAEIVENPESVEIRVENGIARLAGTVQRHWQAAVLEAAARDVEGVIACNSELRWRLDERLEPEVRQDPMGFNLPE